MSYKLNTDYPLDDELKEFLDMDEDGFINNIILYQEEKLISIDPNKLKTFFGSSLVNIITGIKSSRLYVRFELFDTRLRRFKHYAV